MPEKLKGLVESRRFWAAVAGVLAIVLNQLLGLNEQEVLAIAAIVATMIWGDTQRPMETIAYNSRRMEAAECALLRGQTSR